VPSSTLPCDCVYATAVVSPRGDLAVLYFARTKWYGTPLALVDWDLEPLSEKSWLSIDARLASLCIELKARYGSRGVWVESEVLQAAAEAADCKVDLIPAPLTAQAAWRELSLAATVQVRSGQVGATDAVKDKIRTMADTKPFGALKMEGGDRGDDATVPALLYGVAIGLDLALARVARRAAV
jgi:hypothetical protein